MQHKYICKERGERVKMILSKVLVYRLTFLTIVDANRLESLTRTTLNMASPAFKWAYVIL